MKNNWTRVFPVLLCGMCLIPATGWGQKLENKLLYQFRWEFHPRWAMGADWESHWGYAGVHWQSTGFRARGAWKANDWMHLEAGVLYAFIYHDRAFREHEFRPFEQVTFWHGRASRVKMSQQLRLEQRYFYYESLNVHTRSSRLQYQLKARIPLNEPAMQPKTWFAEMWGEVRFNMKSELPVNDFFQRALVGTALGYRWSSRFETMLQYTFQAGTSLPDYYAERHELHSIGLCFTHVLTGK